MEKGGNTDESEEKEEKEVKNSDNKKDDKVYNIKKEKGKNECNKQRRKQKYEGKYKEDGYLRRHRDAK